MQTFQDYLSLKETSAFDVGSGILGKQVLDPDSEKAITAAIQAFEVIMSKNSSAAISFLNRMSESMPEIKAILQRNGMDTFTDPDFKKNMRRGAGKGYKMVRGLGDVSSDGEEISPNVADSYQSLN